MTIKGGHLLTFNGRTWSTPLNMPELAAELEQATRTTPFHHSDILELAQLILAKCGRWEGARIIEVVRDEWENTGEVPPDAID